MNHNINRDRMYLFAPFLKEAHEVVNQYVDYENNIHKVGGDCECIKCLEFFIADLEKTYYDFYI